MFLSTEEGTDKEVFEAASGIFLSHIPPPECELVSRPRKAYLVEFSGMILRVSWHWWRLT